MVLTATSEVSHGAVIEEPGAKISEQGAKFEKVERASVLVIELTVYASSAPAGEELHALVLLLPEATISHGEARPGRPRVHA